MNINDAKNTNVLNAANDQSTRVCNLLYCLYCANLCSTSIRVFNMTLSLNSNSILSDRLRLLRFLTSIPNFIFLT